MNKKFLIFLVSVFFAVGLSAQKPENAENIVISTDRDVYIAGDRLYFSIQLLNNSGKTSDYIYIILNSASGSRIFTGCLRVNNNHTFSSVFLADTLTTGIYQLVSFTNCMRNYGSAFYARKNIIIANRFDNNFSDFIGKNNGEIIGPSGREVKGKTGISAPEITTDLRNYRQREKVTVTLNIPDNMVDKLVSVSVREVAPVSFMPERIPQETTHSKNMCPYLSEKSGIILQGILKNENKTPASGTPVFLSSEDSIANLQHTTTNPEGIFRFFLNPYYFGKTLMVKSNNNFKGFIEIDNKYYFENSVPSSDLIISGDLIKFIENSQKYLTIHHTYKREFLKEMKNPGNDKGYRPSVYETVPQVVYPSDFVYLPDFVEISREILPWMKTRLRNNEYVASILDLDLGEYANMFIFMDGVLVEEVSQFISFDSKKIKKIEILPNTRYVGELNIPSILSINTANHEIRNLKWKFPVEKVEADSIMDLAYYSPPASATIPRYIPDFRQLLYWEPLSDCRKSNTVSFETYTSDCTGEFEIVLTCSDDSGNRIEFKKGFNVIQQ